MITSFYLYQNFEECFGFRLDLGCDFGIKMWGEVFLPRKGGTPDAGQQKSPASETLPDRVMRRPRDLRRILCPGVSATTQAPATCSIRTHSASQIAGRHDEPPGLSLSPGAEHSSKAEIAPQQLPKALCHFDSPPFSYNTYLFDWFGSIIPHPPWVVKPFFQIILVGIGDL